MVNYLLLLVLLIIISLYSFVLSIKNSKKIVSFICSVLIILCSLRYIALIMFMKSDSGVFLYYLKSMVMLSLPSFTIMPIIFLNYTNNRELTKLEYVLIIILACIYSAAIIKAPSGIIIEDDIFKVSVVLKWKYIIAATNGIAYIYLIIKSIKFTVSNKKFSIKALNIFYIAVSIFSIAEVLLMDYGIRLMPSPVISEFCLQLYILFCLNIL